MQSIKQAQGRVAALTRSRATNDPELNRARLELDLAVVTQRLEAAVERLTQALANSQQRPDKQALAGITAQLNRATAALNNPQPKQVAK